MNAGPRTVWMIATDSVWVQAALHNATRRLGITAYIPRGGERTFVPLSPIFQVLICNPRPSFSLSVCRNILIVAVVLIMIRGGWVGNADVVPDNRDHSRVS